MMFYQDNIISNNVAKLTSPKICILKDVTPSTRTFWLFKRTSFTYQLAEGKAWIVSTRTCQLRIKPSAYRLVSLLRQSKEGSLDSLTFSSRAHLLIPCKYVYKYICKYKHRYKYKELTYCTVPNLIVHTNLTYLPAKLTSSLLSVRCEEV
jgi:hypothetical protein